MFPHRELRRDVPAWSETKWLGGYDPDQGVGLFIHAGRMQADIDLWWVQTVAYLPDGTVAVDRSWGPSPDPWTLTTGVFALSGHADGSSTSTFDGAAEIATAERLVQGPAGAGTSVRMRWNLDVTPTIAPWSPFHGDESADWASDAHVQHQHRVRGMVHVAGVDYPFDGVGWGDHSSGARTWDGFGGHLLVNAPLSGAALILIAMADDAGGFGHVMGAVLTDEAVDPVVEVDAPPLDDLDGSPHTLELTVSTQAGAKHRWTVEVLNTLPATITETNSNSNGIDWDCPGNPVVLAECMARFTTPDGVVGHGHLERSVRRDRLITGTGTVRRA